MKRMHLHEWLCEIALKHGATRQEGLDVVPNVYYEPPDNIKMAYPAIRYARFNAKVVNADNIDFYFSRIYRIHVITRDPDETMSLSVKALPYTKLRSEGIINGMHQTVIDITHQ
jgi:hypothetical protein